MSCQFWETVVEGWIGDGECAAGYDGHVFGCFEWEGFGYWGDDFGGDGAGYGVVECDSIVVDWVKC